MCKKRKPLTKKQKIGLGVGIPLGLAAATVVVVLCLHYIGVSKNNATSVPGSNQNDHRIEYELSDEEMADSGLFDSDNNYEDAFVEKDTSLEDKIKNDEDYNLDTDGKKTSSEEAENSREL